MKRLIIAFSLVFIVLPVASQTREQRQKIADMEQMLADALSHGVPERDFGYSVYTLDNKKKKDVELSDAVPYLREKGYIPIETSTKSVLRYGAARTVMDKVSFIKDSDFRAYAFHYFSLTFDFSNARENATFFIPKMRDSWYWGKEICSGEFRTIHNVLWVGDLVNGFMTGNEGYGFMPIDGGWGCFYGDLVAGFPKDDVYNLLVMKKDMSISEIRVNPVGYWDIVRAKKDASGEVLDAMKEFARITYDENAGKVEEEYQRTLALNKDYKSFTPKREIVDEFKTLYGDWPELDKKGTLGKCDELLNAYAVLNALNFEFGDYKLINLAGILGLRYFWNSREEDYDNATVDNGLQIAKENLKDNKCPFKSFYSTASPILAKRRTDLTAHIKEYKKAYAAYEESLVEREQRLEEYRAEMCSKCKIDGSKTIFPKGYIDGWEFLFFGSPAQSEEDGEITLVNGEKISWKYIYDDRYSRIEAKGSILYQTDFDTVDEMVNSIVEQCKKRYCH